MGASDKSDRATAAEPEVSALRDGIPSADYLSEPAWCGWCGGACHCDDTLGEDW